MYTSVYGRIVTFADVGEAETDRGGIKTWSQECNGRAMLPEPSSTHEKSSAKAGTTGESAGIENAKLPKWAGASGMGDVIAVSVKSERSENSNGAGIGGVSVSTSPAMIQTRRL